MASSARSISHRSAAILQPGVSGRVLASFERVCDLVTDDGAVVALVWDGIGNGPLNVVLARGPRAALPVGSRFCVVKRIIAIGDWRVDLAHAVPWDARPDWDAFTRVCFSTLQSYQTPTLAPHASAGVTISGVGGPAVQRAAAEVRARYAERDFPALQRAIAALCGLGPGLTPAGDDWLAGWLLALHLGEDPQSLADLRGMVLEAAARTTTLSRAFLACAAAGEADEEWHSLLDGLVDGSSEQVERAVSRIASHGATSGAAMLAGFLAGIDVE